MLEIKSKNRTVACSGELISAVSLRAFISQPRNKNIEIWLATYASHGTRSTLKRCDATSCYHPQPSTYCKQSPVGTNELVWSSTKCSCLTTNYYLRSRIMQPESWLPSLHMPSKWEPPIWPRADTIKKAQTRCLGDHDPSMGGAEQPLDAHVSVSAKAVNEANATVNYFAYCFPVSVTAEQWS